MRPVLFHIGPLPIFSYGFSIMVGILLGTWLVIRRGRDQGLTPESVMDLAVWVVLGGIGGGRCLFVLQHFAYFRHDILSIFKLWEGGLVLYGALMGAAMTGLIQIHRSKRPVIQTLDAIAPSVPLGIAFGRIGCFFNGCCWGHVCQAPWGIRFPGMVDVQGGHEIVRGSPAFQAHFQGGLIPQTATHSLPVHPTQLYSSLLAFFLFLCLHFYYARRTRRGQVFALLMMGYGSVRFCLEFFRADTPNILGALSFSQIVSIGMLAGGVWYWRWSGSSRTRAEAP